MLHYTLHTKHTVISYISVVQIHSLQMEQHFWKVTGNSENRKLKHFTCTLPDNMTKPDSTRTTRVIRPRVKRQTITEYEPLDIQSEEEFLYVLHIREHNGIHRNELHELSKIIYNDLLHKRQVIAVGERIYKPFPETSVSDYTRSIWKRCVSEPRPHVA